MALPLIAGIAAGAGAAQGLFKTGLGLYQLIKGSRMKPRRPTYEIPEEIRAKLGAAQQNVNARSAAAARAQEDIRAQQEQAQYNVQQGGMDAQTILLGGAMTQTQANIARRNLAAQEAEDQQRRRSELLSAQSEMAQYRDKAFQLNEYEPFMAEAATKSALTQGGLTNLFGGLGDIGNTATSMYLAEQANPGLLMGLFGGTTSGALDRGIRQDIRRNVPFELGPNDVIPYLDTTPLMMGLRPR